MSDLFKTFAFDLQRFDAVIEPVAGQSGTVEIDWADVSDGGLSSDVDTMYAGGDSSFDGKYFWDDSAKAFVEGLSFAGESGVQLSVQYQEYQVTGLSTAGGDSSAIYTFRNITGINTIEFEDSYTVGSGITSLPGMSGFDLSSLMGGMSGFDLSSLMGGMSGFDLSSLMGGSAISIESNAVTIGSFWAQGGDSITISSEIPVTIDASATGVGTFSAAGDSFALDSLVIDTQNASVTSISIDEGLLSTADLKSGVTVNLSQSAGVFVNSVSGISGIMVSEGGDSAAELSVNKSFAYLVDDETSIEIASDDSATVSAWGQATRVVPTEKEDGTITVGDASFTYTSGGSAAVIIDSEAGVQGFEFVQEGDKIKFPKSSATYGIRNKDDVNFIDGDLDFAALSKDGYTAELTDITTSGSGSATTNSYAIDITPVSTKVALTDNLALNNTSNNLSAGDVITIDGDGEITAVRLTTIGDAITGDITDIGGESAIGLYIGSSSASISVSFDGITSADATITYESDNAIKVSGLADDDEININNIDYLFTTAGNSSAVSFSADGDGLTTITAGEGASIDVSGLSTATNKNVIINDGTITSNRDFTYANNASDDKVITVSDNVELSQTGDANRVWLDSDSATVLGSTLSNVAFGSESSGFIITAETDDELAITGVIMEDGDSFTADRATAENIIVSGFTKPEITGFGSAVSFNRNSISEDENNSESVIEISGYSTGAVIEGGVNLAITNYGSRDNDADDQLTVAFDEDANVTNVSNTTNGDIINVTGAGASGINFE